MVGPAADRGWNRGYDVLVIVGKVLGRGQEARMGQWGLIGFSRLC
jgi:hypothetical protein